MLSIFLEILIFSDTTTPVTFMWAVQVNDATKSVKYFDPRTQQNTK